MTGVIFIQQNFNFNNIVFLIDITQKIKKSFILLTGLFDVFFM